MAKRNSRGGVDISNPGNETPLTLSRDPVEFTPVSRAVELVTDTPALDQVTQATGVQTLAPGRPPLLPRRARA